MPKTRDGDGSKFDVHRRALYLDLIRKGFRLGKAAEAVGVTRAIVWKYCQSHPEFQQEIDAAELPVCDQIEDALFASAKSGNVAAQRVWLHHRAPDRWSGAKAKDTQQQAPTDQTLSVDQLRKQLADLLAQLKGPDGSSPPGTSPPQ